MDLHSTQAKIAKMELRKRTQKQVSTTLSKVPPGNGKTERMKRIRERELPLSKATKTPRFGSIYEIDYTINQIDKLSSEKDLKMIREVSNAYYQKLNSIYWDAVERGMTIITESNTPRIYGDGLNYKKFTSDIWAKEIVPVAHTFRALVLQNIMDPKIQSRDLKWTDIISLISPHITCLKFESLDYNNYGEKEKPLTGKELVEFMEQFTKLKRCKLSNLDKLPPAHLEMMLRNLPPSVQVEIYVDNNWGPLFDQCAYIPNISWIVEFVSEEMLEIVTTFLPLIRHLPNLDVKFNIGAQLIDNFRELRTTTQFCHDFQGKINTVNLGLNLNEFADQDEDGVKTCLRGLSSFVNKLELDYRGREWNMDIVDVSWSWPKLKNLKIKFDVSGGNIPFDIMKNSPNLEYLFLRKCPASIIFRDRKKSDQQNINEFFGTLTKLKYLWIPSQKFKKSKILKDCLELLLPKLKIDYHWRVASVINQHYSIQF